jgi:hypothetical protein
MSMPRSGRTFGRHVPELVTELRHGFDELRWQLELEEIDDFLFAPLLGCQFAQLDNRDPGDIVDCAVVPARTVRNTFSVS